MKNYGLLPSPEDINDILTSEISPSVVRYPSEVLPPFDLSVLDQNGYPACVGYSCAAIKQYLEFREKITKTFDGLWIYKECKKIDGMPETEGTFFRAGMKVLQKVGAKPIDSSDPEPYKIGSYAQVDDLSFEGFKKAIFLYGAILVGFKGSNNGWSTQNIRAPKANEKTWGHAVALTGYTKDKLIIQNSWGIKKGDKGFYYTTRDYLPFEAWAVNCDIPTVEESLSGWVAKKYILNDVTVAALKLREKPSISSNVIKVLPKGTSVSLLDSSLINSDGYEWINVKIVVK